MCKSNVDVYHANDRLKVENFLKTNELIISKDTNWLGSGMYFWDNLSNAKYWKNEKLRKNETIDIKIIKGKIFLEKLLDLTDEETVKKIDKTWDIISKDSEIKKMEIKKIELGRKLDIPKVHPHKFRRTLATRAIDKGMPIEQVQKLLGHTKIDTTLQYAMVNQNNVKISHRKYIG